jgi:hypothetical protein
LVSGLAMRSRSDLAIIREEWILRAVEYPIREVIQQDGRIRRWAKIDEMDGKHLRVVLLSDRFCRVASRDLMVVRPRWSY